MPATSQCANRHGSGLALRESRRCQLNKSYVELPMSRFAEGSLRIVVLKTAHDVQAAAQGEKQDDSGLHFGGFRRDMISQNSFAPERQDFSGPVRMFPPRAA